MCEQEEEENKDCWCRETLIRFAAAFKLKKKGERRADNEFYKDEPFVHLHIWVDCNKIRRLKRHSESEQDPGVGNKPTSSTCVDLKQIFMPSGHAWMKLAWWRTGELSVNGRSHCIPQLCCASWLMWRPSRQQQHQSRNRKGSKEEGHLWRRSHTDEALMSKHLDETNRLEEKEEKSKQQNHGTEHLSLER